VYLLTTPTNTASLGHPRSPEKPSEDKLNGPSGSFDFPRFVSNHHHSSSSFTPTHVTTTTTICGPRTHVHASRTRRRWGAHGSWTRCMFFFSFFCFFAVFFLFPTHYPPTPPSRVFQRTCERYRFTAKMNEQGLGLVRSFSLCTPPITTTTSPRSPPPPPPLSLPHTGTPTRQATRRRGGYRGLGPEM
jgi:hypothetical protein